VAEIDVTKIDGDLLAVGGFRTKLVHIARQVPLRLPSEWMVFGW
jgi:hypothetical protein